MNWTQMRHRRPEKDLQVLIWNNKDKQIEISSLNKNCKFEHLESNYPIDEFMEYVEYEDGVITHWMHMPEAPKEF